MSRGDRSARPSPRPGRRFSGMTVLAIEDHADSREMMRQMLEALGIRPLLAEHGQQALAVLVHEQPDLILCDLLMPRMDGFTFIARVRSEPRWRNKRVVALTGLGYESDYQRTWQAGFDGHLVKPIDLEGLTEVLQRYLPQVPRDPAEPDKRRKQ